MAWEANRAGAHSIKEGHTPARRLAAAARAAAGAAFIIGRKLRIFFMARRRGVAERLRGGFLRRFLYTLSAGNAWPWRAHL